MRFKMDWLIDWVIREVLFIRLWIIQPCYDVMKKIRGAPPNYVFFFFLRKKMRGWLYFSPNLTGAVQRQRFVFQCCLFCTFWDGGYTELVLFFFATNLPLLVKKREVHFLYLMYHNAMYIVTWFDFGIDLRIQLGQILLEISKDIRSALIPISLWPFVRSSLHRLTASKTSKFEGWSIETFEALNLELELSFAKLLLWQAPCHR